jgi:hypothetical protein
MLLLVVFLALLLIGALGVDLLLGDADEFQGQVTKGSNSATWENICP